jgi:hypothetical protein
MQIKPVTIICQPGHRATRERQCEAVSGLQADPKPAFEAIT